MEKPMSKKTKKPPTRANHMGNIKFLNPPMLQDAYQIGKGEDLLKGGLALKNSHLLQLPHLKIETTCIHVVTIDILYL